MRQSSEITIFCEFFEVTIVWFDEMFETMIFVFYLDFVSELDWKNCGDVFVIMVVEPRV